MLDFRPLRLPAFRHLATAYTTNELGNWFGDVALAILVFDRTGKPLATAALFLALRFLPAVLAPLLASRVESAPARRILPGLYAAEALIFAALAVISAHFMLPLVLGLAALDGLLAITAKALTRSAAATTLSGEGLLRQGNAILNIGFTTGGAVGPALAGAVAAGLGVGVALWLDAASFAVAAVAFVTAADLRIESDRQSDTLGRLRAGLRQLRDEPGVARLVGAFAFALLFSSIAIPIEVVFAKQTLHAGDSGYGLLLGAWGLGMVIGGAAFAAAERVPLPIVLVASAVTIAAGYCGLAAAPDLAVACVCSALGGLGNGSGGVAIMNALQEALQLRFQGTVMAVVEGLIQLAPAIGFVLGGAIATAYSPRGAYLVSGAGVMAVLLGTLLLPRRVPLHNAVGDIS